jgi:glycosyltransferase involved in cell wall biosynthesis
LKQSVERLGIGDRVRLDLRFLPRDIYANYINHASAVAYLPYDEDSLGYVAMEAATAGKSIITTVDSGGILGLAKDGETGFTVEPSAQALAHALEAALENPTRTNSYGEHARAAMETMRITWPDTLKALLR